ncbi:NAD(P)/FAD-dependent oxidoreductase [Stakelama marina]|uniref:FAD-binding oxidoreductase n=1 Tax=Stakelama marina TaxID=2826939 RepID=A0A8T4IF69_9SPHN|nr:FAD-dependent oxidoreductase [Stakelama marina]MBR0553267.1 FAD-binding oxidoreductase [Stakelama marina]
MTIPLTERHDLRTGSPVWGGHAQPPPSDPLPDDIVDIAIVGAGVMGAMLAERLSERGRSVALVDRRPPAAGSTAASTALILWAMDVPLTHLAAEIGEREAARRWRRVFAAVERLREKLAALPIGDTGERPAVYLAGSLLDADQLRGEAELRQKHGLPSAWLAAEAVGERFGIAPRAALVSRGCCRVDPVRLTLALLDRARRSGATVTWPCEATAIDQRDDHLALSCAGGSLRARQVILASGYERATWFLPPAFSLLSSYAVATAPGTAPLWREDAMLWEAADPYLYARTDDEGRVIAGGCDEDFAAEGPRDAAIGAKGGQLSEMLGAVLGRDPVPVEHRWAAMFGSSPDGLPAIGRARNHDRLWLASGFGGNGVSFAALAAELIAAEMDGTPDPDAACFDPYRFE